MPSGLVLTAPQDLPELTGFLLGVFHASPDAPFVQPDLMRWKYFAPRPDWDGRRSYLTRAADGRISAHGCVAPVTFRTPTGMVTGILKASFLASEVRKRQAGMALALLGGVVDGDDERSPWRVARRKPESYHGSSCHPRQARTSSELPLAVAERWLP